MDGSESPAPAKGASAAPSAAMEFQAQGSPKHGTHVDGAHPRTSFLTKLAAGAAMLIVPLTSDGMPSVHRLGIGSIAALLALVLGVARIRFIRWPWILIPLISVVASGWILAGTAYPGRWVDASARNSDLVFLASAAGFLVAVIWASNKLGLRTAVVLLGLGLTVDALGNSSVQASGNLWKYGLAVPVSVVLLGLAGSASMQLVARCVTAVLAVVSAFADYRSFTVFCVIALVLSGTTVRRNGGTRQYLKALGWLAVLGAVAYSLGTYAASLGLLGDRNKIVTLAQQSSGTSVLIGGRPEWAAFWKLFTMQPWGIGPGVLPSPSDLVAGWSALRHVDRDVSITYVTTYMFGGTRVRLHSVVGDLWVIGGVAGLACGLLLFVVLARQMILLVSRGKAALLPALLTIVALWDLPFSPLDSNLREVLLAVGIGTIWLKTHGAQESLD